MKDIHAAIIFLIISFVTWLSVSFRISSIIIYEVEIFAETKKAVIFYIINMSIASALTLLSYEIVLIFQRVEY